MFTQWISTCTFQTLPNDSVTGCHFSHPLHPWKLTYYLKIDVFVTWISLSGPGPFSGANMLVSGQGSFFFFFGRHPLLEGVGIQQPAPAMVKSSHQPPMSTLQPSNRPAKCRCADGTTSARHHRGWEVSGAWGPDPSKGWWKKTLSYKGLLNGSLFPIHLAPHLEGPGMIAWMIFLDDFWLCRVSECWCFVSASFRCCRMLVHMNLEFNNAEDT